MMRWKDRMFQRVIDFVQGRGGALTAQYQEVAWTRPAPQEIKAHVFYDSYSSVDEQQNDKILLLHKYRSSTESNLESVGQLCVGDQTFKAMGCRMSVVASSSELKEAFEHLATLRFVIGDRVMFEAPVVAYCRNPMLGFHYSGLAYAPRQSSYAELVLPSDLSQRLFNGAQASSPMLREWVTCRVELHGALRRDIL